MHCVRVGRSQLSRGARVVVIAQGITIHSCRVGGSRMTAMKGSDRLEWARHLPDRTVVPGRVAERNVQGALDASALGELAAFIREHGGELLQDLPGLIERARTDVLSGNGRPSTSGGCSSPSAPTPSRAWQPDTFSSDTRTGSPGVTVHGTSSRPGSLTVTSAHAPWSACRPWPVRLPGWIRKPVTPLSMASLRRSTGWHR
jgi:hypothetical protein